MSRYIRKVVVLHAQEEGLPPPMEPIGGEEDDVIPEEDLTKVVKVGALIIALVNQAGMLGGLITFLYPRDTTTGLKVILRTLNKMRRKAMAMPMWGESKSFARRILMVLVKKEKNLHPIDELLSKEGTQRMMRKSMVQRDLRTADYREIVGEFPLRGEPENRRAVKKTNVKIILRVVTVIVGLLSVAISLFQTLSKWEDDPAMVELFADSKSIMTTVRSTGVSAASQKIQTARLYRILRNTAGIGSLLPRRGLSLT